MLTQAEQTLLLTIANSGFFAEQIPAAMIAAVADEPTFPLPTHGPAPAAKPQLPDQEP